MIGLRVGGTLPYAAPEVLLGSATDATIDFWSVGVLLYELLAGQVRSNAPALTFYPRHPPYEAHQHHQSSDLQAGPSDPHPRSPKPLPTPPAHPARQVPFSGCTPEGLLQAIISNSPIAVPDDCSPLSDAALDSEQSDPNPCAPSLETSSRLCADAKTG